jgi:hypothetical protein
MVLPYSHNIIDIILILGVGLSYVGAMCSLIAFIEVPYQQVTSIVLVTVPAVFPFLYILGYVFSKSLRKLWRQSFTIKRRILGPLWVRMSEDESLLPLLNS